MKKIHSAIFSDIDGTIYDYSKVIDNRAIIKANIAMELGIDFVIATGNGLFSQVHKVGESFKAEYAIVSNGAGIYDFKSKKYIYKKLLPKEELESLINLANDLKIGFQFWDEEFVYLNEYVDQKTIAQIVNVMDCPLKFFNKNEYQFHAFKCEFYNSEKSQIDIVEEFLKTRLYEYARISNNHIEITTNNVSKGSALEWLCKNVLNIKPENCMAIGDSANDVSMLKVVGYSYVMANARSNDVRKYAKYNAADVNQNGLGLAIEDFLYRIGI